MDKEYLSNIDAALLKVEDPTNLMMVTAAIVFSEPIEFEQLLATIEKRLLRINRFRQKVIYQPKGTDKPFWEYDPDFNIRNHLVKVSIPEPFSESSFIDLISQLASTPLDLQKPAWQFHFVENYGGRCALVCRLHHCIADGMALVQVLLSLTDSDPSYRSSNIEMETIITPNGHDRNEYVKLALDSFNASNQAVAEILSTTRYLFRNPKRMISSANKGLDAANVIKEFLLLEPDPDTVLSGELGVNKRAAYSQPISLDEVKTIRDKLGGTVNDVLMSAMTGSLRRYLELSGEPVDDFNIRVTVPVNLRSPEDIGKLGNKMGAVFVSIPIDTAEPEERLYLIRNRMDNRKKTPEGTVFFYLLNALGMVSESFANKLIHLLGNRATAVLTNVKGPSNRLCLAGSPIETILYWVPTTGHLGVGISIISYAGDVRLGVITDQALVPDPETLVDSFHQDFDKLLASAKSKEKDISFKQSSEKLIAAIEELDAVIDGIND